MFREMRRKNQALGREEIDAVLNRGTSGVLALSGDDGYPYALPISYAYEGDRLIFHCALTGHKLDAIAREPKASFCVIDQDQVVSAEYTTYYRSVIVFGRMRVLEGEEKRSAAMLLAERYAPGEAVKRHTEEIDGAWDRLCMLEMRIEHLTGKAAKELTLPKK